MLEYMQTNVRVNWIIARTKVRVKAERSCNFYLLGDDIVCGRYYIEEEDITPELKRIIDAISRKHSEGVKTSGEVFPSDTVPVIAGNKSLVPSVFAMKWGYTMPNKKLIINARSESAHQRALFADGMERRRCVIPASRYFEWQESSGGKIKHGIFPNGMKMFYMAGIYRFENDRPVFSILTKDANREIRFIHERMPVVLTSVGAAVWLDKRSTLMDAMEISDVEMNVVNA